MIPSDMLSSLIESDSAFNDKLTAIATSLQGPSELNEEDTLSRLKTLSSLINLIKDTSSNYTISDDNSNLILNVCLPVIEGKSPFKGTIGLAGDILSSVYPSLTSEMQTSVLEASYKILKIYITEEKQYLAHDVEPSSLAMPVLDLLANCSVKRSPASESPADWKKRMFNLCLQILLKGEEAVASRTAVTIIPLLIQPSQLTELWQCVKNSQDCTEDPSARPLFLLCALADIFLPAHGFPPEIKQLLESDEFWAIFQMGINASTPIGRKKTCYLLKRITDILFTGNISILPSIEDPIFHWDSVHRENHLAAWDALILLAETLEERQMHMVKPVLQSRMKVLQKASQSVLHSSWMFAILMRISQHQSSQIKEWGLKYGLTMPFDISKPKIQQFFHGSFVKMMTDSKVFYSPTTKTIDDFPPLDKCLETFFLSIINSEAGNELFMEGMFRAMSGEFWNGTCLVLIICAMSRLPSSPLIGMKSLSYIKEILARCCDTVESHIKGALHCYFLQMLLRMMNTTQIRPSDFADAVSIISSVDCLKRGGALWKETCDWLQKIMEDAQWAAEAVDYLKQGFSSLLPCAERDLPCNIALSRFFVMCSDAKLKQADIVSILDPVTDVLNNAGVRVYMDANKVHRSLTLLCSVLDELRTHDKASLSPAVESTLFNCVSSSMNSILAFILRQLTEFTEVKDLDPFSSSVLFLHHCTTADPLTNAIWTSSYVKPLITSCVQLLKSSQNSVLKDQITRHAALLILSALSSSNPPGFVHETLNLTFFCDNWIPSTCFRKPKDFVASKHGLTWGILASRHIGLQWSMLDFHLSNHGIFKVNNECVEAVLDTLDISTSADLSSMLKCLRQLIFKMPGDAQLKILSGLFTRVNDGKHNSQYWPLLDSFLALILSKNHLSAEMDETVNDWITQLLKLAEIKSGVGNYISRHLENAILSSPKPQHIKWLLELIIFGPIHSRGKRFFLEVQQYLAAQGSDLPTNEYADWDSGSDNKVRANALSMLAKLCSKQDKKISQGIIKELMRVFEALSSITGFKEFPNSLQHRQKHRVMCALFVLESSVDDSFLLTYADFLWGILHKENHPSVRTYSEWLCARLMHRFPSVQERLWQFMKGQSTEHRSVTVVSVLTLLMHLSKTMTEAQNDQVPFYERVLTALLPWCMAHHFAIRVCAQASLLTLWQQCRSKNLTQILLKYQHIEHFAQSISDAHTQVLLSNFVCQLDPIRDLSMESLVYTVPRLCAITELEWLRVELFKTADDFWKTFAFPLCSSNEKLAQSPVGLWKSKPQHAGVEVQAADSSGDIQKKTIPWRNMMTDTDLEIDFSVRKTSCAGGLILVTSLINKIPNLGGLCRTSEIFGVSEYVVANLSYTKEKMFEALSLSAENWIPITEVSVNNLTEFLNEKRKQGYTLVGVEQTAQSNCLTNYQFPKKTLLLLGNEKEGIPVNLIQQLDVCVEIPQQGLLRSLNVHVSGALLIWEYTRQQLCQNS